MDFKWNSILGKFRLDGNLSIRFKLLILFVFLSVVPAITIGIMSYSKSIAAVETKASRYSLQILEQTSENINQMLRSYEMICYNISANSSIIESMNKNEESFDIDSVLLIKRYLNNIIISRRDEIASIFLYSSGGKEFREGDTLATAILNFTRSTLYMNTKSANGNVEWTTSAEDPEEFRSKGFLAVSRLLNDSVTGRSEGAVLIFIKEKIIEDMYSKYLLENGGTIFVLDRYGRVISHPNKDLLGKDMPGFENFRVLGEEKGYFLHDNGNGTDLVSFWTLNQKKGWKIISVIPYRTLMAEARDIRNTTFIIILICITVSVTGAYFFSSKISKPIINIAEDIVNVEKSYSRNLIDKLEEDVNLININSALQIIKSAENRALESILEEGSKDGCQHSSNNEVYRISRSVSAMAEKIKNLVEEVYKQKLLKREAELKSLQSQINPHFLYNSLEKIKGIAELEGSRRAAEMIATLGKLFRLNLNRGKDMVMISQEVEHVNLYLALQSLGANRKYQIQVNIEEDIQDCAIIKMTLQPIVENAVIHGLEAIAGRNCISIKGYASEKEVFIEISDNGKGIDIEKLERLNRYLSGINVNNTEDEDRFGIALRNVNERLRLYFGKHYGVALTSKKDIGTTVLVRIPKIYYDEWGNRSEAVDS